MNQFEQAYVAGFIKRAQMHGCTEAEAIEILKQASFLGGIGSLFRSARPVANQVGTFEKAIPRLRSLRASGSMPNMPSAPTQALPNLQATRPMVASPAPMPMAATQAMRTAPLRAPQPQIQPMPQQQAVPDHIQQLMQKMFNNAQPGVAQNASDIARENWVKKFTQMYGDDLAQRPIMGKPGSYGPIQTQSYNYTPGDLYKRLTTSGSIMPMAPQPNYNPMLTAAGRLPRISPTPGT